MWGVHIVLLAWQIAYRTLSLSVMYGWEDDENEDTRARNLTVPGCQSEFERNAKSDVNNDFDDGQMRKEKEKHQGSGTPPIKRIRGSPRIVDLHLAAIRYGIDYDYTIDPNIAIGKLDKCCRLCNAIWSNVG